MTVTLSEAVRLHADYRATWPAASDVHAGFTYRQLDRAGDRLAAALVRRSSPGDRVALAMPSSAAYLVAVLACFRAGRVACPLNTKLSAAEQAEYLATVTPTVVLTDEDHREPLEGLGLPLLMVSRSAEPPAQLLSNGDPPFPLLPVDSPAILFGTGGTTGVPKAAVYTHRQLGEAITSYMLDGKRTPSTYELTYSPFFHIALVAPLATRYLGGRVQVLAAVDPADVVGGLEDGANVIGGAAPTTWRKLLESTAFLRADTSGLRSVFLGSAAVGPETIDHLLRLLPTTSIFSGFGSTEHGAVSYATRPDLEAGRLDGVGRPLPGVSVRIVADDGSDAAPGTPGELVVTTPWQASGYWGNTEQTAATWTEKGVRIGDIGSLEDGWLTLVGRKKEMIITGGENVFPNEVERVIAQHPAVAEAVVYGVPDAYWGERVEVAIVPRGRETPDVAELKRWGASRLASYKTPKNVVTVQRIPLTGALKPDRARLCAEALGRGGDGG